MSAILSKRCGQVCRSTDRTPVPAKTVLVSHKTPILDRQEGNTHSWRSQTMMESAQGSDAARGSRAPPRPGRTSCSAAQRCSSAVSNEQQNHAGHGAAVYLPCACTWRHRKDPLLGQSGRLTQGLRLAIKLLVAQTDPKLRIEVHLVKCLSDS